jgi:hypothetical protein
MNIIKKTFIKLRLKVRQFFLKLAGVTFPSSVKVQTSVDTLNEIRRIISGHIPGAYFRFGDGEVNALDGLGAIEQAGDKKLAVEMREAFSLTGPGIIKSLMINSRKFGFEPGMEPGMYLTGDQWADNLLERCYQYFIGEKIYSHAALPYTAVFEPEAAINFLKFLKSFNPIFVGNKNTPPEVLRKLFGVSAHVKTEPSGAYGQIDRLERETLAALKSRNLDYDVVVIAAGPTAKILQKRLLQHSGRNLFIFDFSSLIDALSGRQSRAWMSPGSFTDNSWDKFLEKI